MQTATLDRTVSERDFGIQAGFDPDTKGWVDAAAILDRVLETADEDFSDPEMGMYNQSQWDDQKEDLWLHQNELLGTPKRGHRVLRK